MKKIFYLMILFFPVFLIAQTDWTILNSGTTINLNSVDFIDISHGIAVGDNGTILHTIDGGNTWEGVVSGTYNTLNDVCFINEDTIVTVGDNATILRTIDGGVSWLPITVGVYSNLISVDIDISGNGIAGGSDQTILRTDNAGNSWSITQTGYMGGGWQGTQMVDGDVGFVFGSNSIFQPFVGKTVNSGTSFSFYNFYFVQGGVFNEGKLFDGHFFDEFNGVTAGRRWDGLGCISATSDLNNWTTQHFPTPFYGIDFSTETDGYVVGENGTILHTTDGGIVWEAEDSGVYSQLNSVVFLNESLGFVVGDNGVILKKEPTFPPPENLIAIVIDYNSIIRLEWGAATRTEQRELLGYNIYFEGVLIEFVTDCPFDFYGPFAAGDYYFEVTAVYEEGESEPATVVATVVLNPPNNLILEAIPPNFILSWNAPIRGLEYYNVYRNGELEAEGLTGTMYIITEMIPGLNLFNVTAIYSGGYESGFSNDAEYWNPSDVDDTLIPINPKLLGNYPNPFNPTTTISFSVPQTSLFVTLEIYNLKGQKVKTLECGESLSTTADGVGYSIIWNGTDENNQAVSSGIYLYRLKVGNDFSETKRMLLLK